MKRAGAVSALVGLGLYLALLLLYRLGEIPGLHGDEAWSGHFAMRLLERGFYTPHEMNGYTGAFYGWAVSKSYGLFGVNAFALRLPGVLANLVAAAIVAVEFGAWFGLGAAAGWLGLVALWPMFLMKSRVAWEVYALQGLFLSIDLALLRGFLERRDFRPARALAFLLVNAFGVFNHFIFLSVPLSLLLLATAQFYYEEKPELADLVRLAAACAAACTALCAVKLNLSEAFWGAHRVAGAAALLAPLAAALAAFLARPEAANARLRSLAHMLRAERPAWGHAVARVLALGWLVSAALHGTALVQIGSGVAIFKRMFSHSLPLWASAPLHLWAGFLLAACAALAVRAWREEETFGPTERFLALWPAVYFCLFSAFRTNNSIRYYAIVSFLITAALGAGLWRVVDVRRWRFRAAAALAFALLHGFLWRELIHPVDRPPFRFRVGWHMERSAHFMRKEPLYDVARAQRACLMDGDGGFIDLPVKFYMYERPFPCDLGAAIRFDYCPECARAPYFRWGISR